MNIQEMHIEIQQGTQNIAANSRRKLLSEEIDWLLNKNQERFIQSKLKPNEEGTYQIDQLDLDALRILITPAEPVARIVEDTYRCILPADYSYLLSDDSKTVKLCGTTASKTTVTESVLKIPLKTGKTSSKYYVTATLQVGTKDKSIADILTEFGGTYAGTSTVKESFYIRDLFLWYFRQVYGLPVYWERYDGVYAPNHFLIPGQTVGKITVDGTAFDGTVQVISYSYYADSAAAKWKNNRLTSHPKITRLNTTPFYKSTAESPLSEMKGTELVVYGDESFTVTRIGLKYVRKPRKMNLSLGQGCELPEEFHQAICDLTVEYFKALTADPNWEVKLKDNLTRSISTNQNP